MCLKMLFCLIKLVVQRRCQRQYSTVYGWQLNIPVSVCVTNRILALTVRSCVILYKLLVEFKVCARYSHAQLLQ